jgi:hypothetical protein
MSDAEQDGAFLSRWSRRKAQVRQGSPLSEARDAAANAATTAAASTATRDTAMPTVSHPASPADAPKVPPPVDSEAAVQPSPLTLADVTQLTRESDYSRFVARGVEPEVRNAALRKLFTDPQFNVMDGLDTYIDDYGKPDPIPESMLRQMTQSKFLGLFKDEDDETARQAALAQPVALASAPGDTRSPDATAELPVGDTPSPPEATSDEDTDLRLQPHDAVGRPGPEPGPGQDGGRER